MRPRSGSGAARLAAIALLSAMAAGCQSATFFLANVPNAFGSYHRTRDLPYGSDPRQRLDAYSPTGAIDRPIVIFWYGGSWQMGTKSQYAFVGAALARQGYVVFLPDYRLYPQVRFPLFVEDGASAVAWVQRHAREFGGDPARIVLMGHSAGAYMAAFLALNDAALAKAGADTRSILGLVGLSGPYALEPNTEALRTIFGSPYLPVDWQPVQFVSDHSPPTLLIQGLADRVVAPSHTTRLRDALQAHHVRVETELYPGKGHADSVAPFAVLARFRSPAQSQTVRFIESVTGKSAASR